MSRLKTLAKLLTPPFLWELASQRKCGFTQTQVTRIGAFEGPMSSWDTAVALSDGWVASTITDKTLEAALKVRDGVVEFEQDAVIRNKIIYSSTILAFLLLSLSRHKSKLNIIDFGGSLGTNYFQNRKILKHLAATRIMWNIVERPVLAELGKSYFANPELQFFPSLDMATSGLADCPDSVLFSGSLQYLAEPLSAIDQVIALGAKLLAFDRLLVSPETHHSVYIQHPDPKVYGPTTYPVWCFSRDCFIGKLVSNGFTLVEHFTANPSAHFDHCGMVFELDV